MEALYRKQEALQAYLKGLGSVAVAFSAGVDSTFLLKTAHEVLGERAVAVTAQSCFIPESVPKEAAAFCSAEGIRHVTVQTNVLALAGIAQNPPERCYICKKSMMESIVAAAGAMGIATVAEGTNADDALVYRPGLRAVAALGVKSPLKEAGLSKNEIRALSRALGLPTWNKPPYSCLATRFAYGERLTPERLAAVEHAERLLLERGFRRVRVRVHGGIARIEVDPADFSKLLTPQTAAFINERLRQLGFIYVTLDLGGYVSGSMDRLLGAQPLPGEQE